MSKYLLPYTSEPDNLKPVLEPILFPTFLYICHGHFLDLTVMIMVCLNFRCCFSMITLTFSVKYYYFSVS